jgi:peptidoglycan/LPS O-acetylase OafA/YrhL
VSSAPARLPAEPVPPAPAPATGKRLAWLDALRGFAALCVVFNHLGWMVLQRLHGDVCELIDTGQYGVFVFFLVSGYIIPASLERKGSVRGFWVSRGFRLYPLYILGIAVSLLAWKTGFGPIRGADTQPKTWVYSLPFMMSNMLDGANVPAVIWTLSFEMVFYLLLSALFTFRVHRHSAGYALTAVIGAVALGGILPLEGLTHTFGSRRVAIATDVLLFIGLLLAVSGRRVPRMAGAAIGAVTGLTLLLFNTSYPYNWSGLTILALMFTGTMLYRAERGEFSRAAAAVVAVLVFALAITAGVWHSLLWHMNGHDQLHFDLQWISGLALAGATFGVGMLLRHRTVPRALAWLGLVSYSVYLLHPIVLNAYWSFPVFHRPHPFAIQVGLAAGILAVVLVSAALSYYLVEAPMQRIGHRFARRLQTRFGPDAITDDRPVPDAPAVAAGDPLLEGTQGLPDPAHDGQVPPLRPAASAGQPAPPDPRRLPLA